MKKKEKGLYFGPYPSAKEARSALSFLQGIFKLRQCDNAFFKRRTRPCLQYQIKRCTAPCVNYIDESAYQIDVQNTILFLQGKSDQVITKLIKEMEELSEQLNYEKAADLRDRISMLRQIQDNQIIVGTQSKTDVIGVAIQGGIACLHLLMIRDGIMLGSRQYFPNASTMSLIENNKNNKNDKMDANIEKMDEMIEAFIMQHYLKEQQDELPREILISHHLANQSTLEDILSEHAKVRVNIRTPVRGMPLKWLEMAMQNAKTAVSSTLLQSENLINQFQGLQDALQLPAIPERIECFDVSHTFGDFTVASCVVFDNKGPVKTAYRHFNIRGITKGDDYAALRQALNRRYTKLKAEGGMLPDVLLIDGGRGQLSQALAVLNELQVTGVIVLGVAKGPLRRSGLETIYKASGETVDLAPDAKAFHLILKIRDEAHRFAIKAHRKKRGKEKLRSKLEDIVGIGKERRLELLRQFGGLQGLSLASVEELTKVKGISVTLAKRIYEALHGS